MCSVGQVEQPVVTCLVEVREGGVDGDVQVAVKRRAALRVNLDSLVIGDIESRPELGAEWVEWAGSRRRILDVSAGFVSNVDVRLESINVLGALEHVSVLVACHERVWRQRGLLHGKVVRAPSAVAVVVGRGSLAARLIGRAIQPAVAVLERKHVGIGQSVAVTVVRGGVDVHRFVVEGLVIRRLFGVCRQDMPECGSTEGVAGTAFVIELHCLECSWLVLSGLVARVEHFEGSLILVDGLEVV